MTYHLIFIHGFLSSPQSIKAGQLADYIAEHHPECHFLAPNIPLDPAHAMMQLSSLITDLMSKGDLVGLMGSSMGGYYAMALSDQFGVPAVLLNPAVAPELSLAQFAPHVTNPETGEELPINEGLAAFLKKMFPARRLNPKKIMLLLQTGDEVLDYRQALNRLPGIPAIIEPGGDHRFVGFERYLGKICSHIKHALENNWDSLDQS